MTAIEPMTTDPLATPSRSPEMFRRPLDVILDEHYRQRLVCDRLDQLAAQLEIEAVADRAATILSFLTEDLALHTEDEERDLFPFLRQRCLPEDGIDEVLIQLSDEHDLDKDLVDFIVADMQTIASGHRLANPIRLFMNVSAFTATQRRHLGWENRVVLPLARKRLTDDDLGELGSRMAARRGIVSPAI